MIRCVQKHSIRNAKKVAVRSQQCYVHCEASLQKLFTLI